MSSGENCTMSVGRMEEVESTPFQPEPVASSSTNLMECDTPMDIPTSFEMDVDGTRVEVTIDSDSACKCHVSCPIHKTNVNGKGKEKRPHPMDDDEDRLIFFEDNPRLYGALMRRMPNKPVPTSLKIWRDMLNDEFESGQYQTPLNVFYRIFLNRQLGCEMRKKAPTEGQRSAGGNRNASNGESTSDDREPVDFYKKFKSMAM